MAKTVWAFIFILFIFYVNGAEAILVDRILAVVNRQLVTLSDLHRYEAFLALSDGKKNWAPPLSPSKTVLQQLIDQRLLLQEAEKFEVNPPKAADLAKLMDCLGARYTTPDEFQRTLHRWGLNQESLRQELEDHLTAERFVDQRIKFFVIIPPAEIQKYYESHQEEYREKRLEEALAQVAKQLTEQKAEEKLETYLKKLREKASIQINL